MFASDLIAGIAIEKQLGDTLENKGIQVSYNITTQLDDKKKLEELRKYDLKYIYKDKEVNIEVKIEVKADFASSTTGNVAVELKCVSESEAKYFAYYLPDDKSFYFIPTRTLKEAYWNKSYSRLTSSKENGTSLMLFKKDYFKTLSRKSLINDFA